MNRKQQRCSNMQAFQDVDVEITRILQKDMTAGSPLLPETTYQIFCIAEDDWKEQASKMTRDGKGEKASERERETERERERESETKREGERVDLANPSFARRTMPILLPSTCRQQAACAVATDNVGQFLR